MLSLIAVLVPETYHPVLLRRKAVRLRRETGDDRWKAPIETMQRSIAQTVLRSCYRPFLLLLLEPMCPNLCLFSALLLGVLYLFFGAFEVVFTENHHFKLWQIGLSFSGLLVGQLITISTDHLWHRNYLRLVRNREKNGGQPGDSEPEYRLPPTIAGGILVPIGLFWYDFTGSESRCLPTDEYSGSLGLFSPGYIGSVSSDCDTDTWAMITWKTVPIIGSTIFAAGSVYAT